MLNKIWHWVQHRLRIPHWDNLEYRGTPMIDDDVIGETYTFFNGSTITFCNVPDELGGKDER